VQLAVGVSHDVGSQDQMSDTSGREDCPVGHPGYIIRGSSAALLGSMAIVGFDPSILRFPGVEKVVLGVRSARSTTRVLWRPIAEAGDRVYLRTMSFAYHSELPTLHTARLLLLNEVERPPRLRTILESHIRSNSSQCLSMNTYPVDSSWIPLMANPVISL
jgi:hypothetical protein